MSENPIKPLREHARRVAAAKGLEVDEASFDEAERYCDEPVSDFYAAGETSDWHCEPSVFTYPKRSRFWSLLDRFFAWLGKSRS